MKCFEKWAIWLILGLGLCGCTKTSEVKTSEKTAFQGELKGRERDRSTEVVQTGPETITTTTEEFVAEENLPVPLGGDQSSARKIGTPSAEGDARVIAGTSGVTPHLVKRTITIDQRGPVVATKTEVATKVESASLTEKQEKASDTKKRTSYWPPPWLILVGLVLLGLGGWALKRGVKIASL